MIKINIISNDNEQAENLKTQISVHYFVHGIFKSVDHIVAKKTKATQPSIILYCNNEHDDFSKLKKEFRKSNIIIFNDLENDKLLFNAIHLGIKSFVHHSQKINELLDIIEVVSIGGSYISNNITYKLFKYIKDITDFMLGKKTNKYHTLSSREVMVFELLLNGNSYKVIALSLNISVDTVRKHISRIYKKLNIHSKGELYSLHYDIDFKSKQYNQLFLNQIN
jgi:two-component system nitrate/nitrite response regulator NarP